VLQVFFFLERRVVTCPVQLDHQLAVQEDEVGDVAQVHEQVLGPVPLPEGRKGRLKDDLGRCRVEVESMPVGEHRVSQDAPLGRPLAHPEPRAHPAA
jgi:hypothetical protein